MRLINTNLLNYFYKNGIKPLKDALVGKLDKNRLVNNMLTTEEGFALDARVGPVVQKQIDEINSNLSSVTANIGNLGKQKLIGTGFSTNTQSPWPLTESIKSYRYILVIINTDYNIWTSVIPSIIISNNMNFYYNCKANNSYYVEGHFRFNSDTTITVEQTALAGWTGNPGSVKVYGIY